MDAATQLKSLAVEVEACRKCALGHSRTQSVFGVGDPNADLVFVGEAPGFYEDQKGEPFVGNAGQLLTKLIGSKLHRGRENVYICNTLRCRPPNNRDPQPDEIAACRPWLQQQLSLIRPRLLVTLGNFATKLLLETETGISRLHGRRFDVTFDAELGVRPTRTDERPDALLIPAFHPSAALRGGSAMRDLESDFDEVARALAELGTAPEREPDPEPELAAPEPEPVPEPQQMGLF